MARGYTPVAVVLVLAVTVLAAGSVVYALPSMPGDPPPKRAVAVDASSDGSVTLTLVSGPSVDVRDLDVTVTVDGEPLAHQPPVPFFAATGFVSAPTGPFNPAADSTWTVGESTSFRVGSTNDPSVAAGDTVEVTLRVDGSVIAGAETTAASKTVSVVDEPAVSDELAVSGSVAV